MRMVVLLASATTAAATVVAARPAADLLASIRSKRAAVHMSDDGDKRRLALPSIQTLLFGFIGARSASTLVTEVPRLLSGASPAPYVGIVVNVGFFGWSLLNLGKTLGLGKRDYYDDLDDASVASLARDAGQWALAGEVPTRSKDGRYEVATFAGGCFWGTELHFQRLPGVVQTCVGYTQGAGERPSYEQVCSGLTGHTEGLQITYDPAEISFDALCDKLMATVDSTALNRVGNDRGTQYRHGIYYHSPAQEAAGRRALEREQAQQGRPVVTELKPAKLFWPAENYHQRYLEKGGQSAAKRARAAVRCYG